ncbi:hypothetical protein J8273_8069 [Carpediemonas membranifera]|uniref:RNI-like protein n=1 Tax=Carpediemonas membranifera TaxID=201153 RepID=A0A8J6B002_9EUKA|nr:hypothetical protein J8273_8069 [Carpediemonas membranifera]|eukprot:KAG9390032.1 hypothetical protein J8273_8069 [Carpediemonas membranifera]
MSKRHEKDVLSPTHTAHRSKRATNFLSALHSGDRLDARFISAAKKNAIRADVQTCSSEQLSKLVGAMRHAGKLLHEISLNARPGVPMYSGEEEKAPRVRPGSVGKPEIHETKECIALMNAIGALVAASPRLKVLQLHGIPLAGKSLSRLAKALAKSKNLHTLAVVDCAVSTEAAASIFKALLEVPTVQSVDLSRNPIADPVMASVVHWVGRHAERRDMDCFNMALHTSETVADQHHKVHGPHTLRLSHCRLSDDGVGLLASTLARDEYFTNIDISGHRNVSTAAAKAVRSCLGENRTIVEFDITSCPVYDSVTLTAIDRMLARNRRATKRRDKVVERRAKAEASKDVGLNPPLPKKSASRASSVAKRPQSAAIHRPSLDMTAAQEKLASRASAGSKAAVSAEPASQIKVKPLRKKKVKPSAPTVGKAAPKQSGKGSGPDAEAHKETLAELGRQKMAADDLQMRVLELTAQRNTLAKADESESGASLSRVLAESDRLLSTPEGKQAVEALNEAVARIHNLLSSIEPAFPPRTPSAPAHGDGDDPIMTPVGRPADPVSPVSMSISNNRRLAEDRREHDLGGLGDVEPAEGLSDISDLDEESVQQSLRGFYASLMDAGHGRSLVREVNRLSVM